MNADPHPKEKRLRVGTTVAVFPLLFQARDWTEEALRAREAVPLRMGEAAGIIVAVHDAHGLCYDVRFTNGVEACYDPDEVEPRGSTR